MNEKYFHIFWALMIIAVLSVIITRGNIKKNKIDDNSPTVAVEPSIEDVVARLRVAEKVNPETSSWKDYTSKKFGIKFKYPSTLFVFEGKINLYNTYVINLYEDTSENRHYAENINTLDSDAEDLNKISISATPLVGDFIASDIVKNLGSSTKWQEIIFKNNKAVANIGLASMLGSDYHYDGIIIARNKTLFRFSVPHWLENPEKKDNLQQVREDYYKILSTLEFLK